MANIPATFAPFERRLISQRTKDALAANRAQDVRLARSRQLPVAVVSRIPREREQGQTLAAISEGLNRDAAPTAQGVRTGPAFPPATISFGRRADDPACLKTPSAASDGPAVAPRQRRSSCITARRSPISTPGVTLTERLGGSGLRSRKCGTRRGSCSG
jgi:hypothetical protein